jgi:hypothetical protein
MTGIDLSSLEILLDRMIPGDKDFPLPSGLDLAEAMAAHERFGVMAEAMVAALPADFSARSKDAQIVSIECVERDKAAVFDPFVVALYSLYYVHPTVLAAVERASGYAARAPQPEGYALKPFDPAIVAVPASRGAQYRDAGTGEAA